jgi:hypothetical protein
MKCDSQVHSWPAPSQALALVANPRLGLQHFHFRVSDGLGKRRSSVVVALVVITTIVTKQRGGALNMTSPIMMTSTMILEIVLKEKY